MPLDDGAVYSTPDGRRFQAKLDKRHYGKDRSWTLFPVKGKTLKNSGALSRDELEEMLFMDRGKIMRMDFDTTAIMVDTGLKISDLKPAPNSDTTEESGLAVELTTRRSLLHTGHVIPGECRTDTHYDA